MNFLNKLLMISASNIEMLTDVKWFKGNRPTIGYELINSAAIISIHGLLTKHSELFSVNTTSYEEIFEAINDALENPLVESISFDIDSPGGEVSGLFDLVDFIYSCRTQKPIYAYVNDSACSAAYAIASAADKVFITRTSMVGSIGVVAVHSDISEAEKKAGIRYTTVYAGAKKNELSPHEPLTEEAATGLQGEVDRIYQIFVETVARNRGISADVVRGTEAGIFYGKSAVVAGLADEVISNCGVIKTEKPRTIIGGAAMESVKEETAASTDAYKAEVLEIVKLCKLAHAESKTADFLERQLTLGQVKEELLDSMNTKDEIMSSVYQRNEKAESPVITASRNRAKL